MTAFPRDHIDSLCQFPSVLNVILRVRGRSPDRKSDPVSLRANHATIAAGEAVVAAARRVRSSSHGQRGWNRGGGRGRWETSSSHCVPLEATNYSVHDMSRLIWRYDPAFRGSPSADSVAGPARSLYGATGFIYFGSPPTCSSGRPVW